MYFLQNRFLLWYNIWTRRCGIDYDSIRILFDGIYD